MKIKNLLTICLLSSVVIFSQNVGERAMKDQGKTKTGGSKQDNKLLFEKIVHFTVKQDRTVEFDAWVKKNQKEFAETLPPGWTYLGCYRTVFHTGKHGWQFRYEIEGMGAYDNLVMYEDKTSERLFGEIYDFIDRQLPMEVEILQKVKSDTHAFKKE